MNQYNIRKARNDDAEKIASLYGSSFPEHILVHRNSLNDPNYILSNMCDANQVWKIAKLEDKVIGVAVLCTVPIIGSGEIERVCVDKDFRGNGVSYALCNSLMGDVKEMDLGWVEAFARGNQPAMQRTFEKLGFNIYGIAPRFEIIHEGRTVRENFVHMGLLLKPEMLDVKKQKLIPEAEKIYRFIKQFSF